MTNVLLIGASAGGIEPLIAVAEHLPADLPASVLVVVHIPPDAESRLPEILQRRSGMRVGHAVDGEALRDGRIFVAPPDRHLIVDDGRVRVVRGPRQNRHRPAIDALLRTAAQAHGPDVVAVILSGAAGDGVAGALIVANRGGRVIVQDPGDALFESMPRNVLAAVPAAMTLPADRIADAVCAAFEERSARRGTPSRVGTEATMDQPSSPPPIEPGRPSYSCPDCGGILEEVVEDGPLRFRCRVGHEFYADDLASAQWTTLEDALWAALRGMEENAELSSRLARMADERGATTSAERHRDRRTELLSQARLIRQFLLAPGATMEQGDSETRLRSVGERRRAS
ncbi:MAG: chemotaxis protein CheB [Chloroflexota bacterium]